MSSSRPDTEVRAELLAAGERVFAEKGYAAATIGDVIAASRTSRASYYRYFASKSDLFEQLSLDCFREMRAVMRGLGDLGPPPIARRDTAELLERYHELHGRYGGVIRAWTELSGPPDSPVRRSGAAVVKTLAAEMEQVMAAVEPGSTRAERALRATLLFLLIERSSFYVSNRVSRVDRDRLPPTLATFVHRGFLGGES
ncbi:MAG TPA: TetR/AcrR family transcriptional regulator [Acidimicrobiales bacterium]|nr:TetR/AcrR family transcriptional regulator [Acidimicrobiales bacterium]